jgi:hydrogenase nickel incorporation protein HypB
MIQTITVPPDETVEVSLADSLFDENDRRAADNRRLLEAEGIAAVDVMGAIGSGKTTLITRLTERLKNVCRMAVINGDPSTADDVLPIAALGVPVIQIAANACHLDADLVSQGLARLDLPNLDLVIIENVGNLICPGSFALGSRGRIVVVSVTEGPWMVRKHPNMFLGARFVVINKQDLAGVMGVDCAALVEDVHRLKPDIRVFLTSCRTGQGLDELAEAVRTF